MDILLIRSPELAVSAEPVPPEKQVHGAVLLPLGILQLGSYVRHEVADVDVHYLDLHLKCKLAEKRARGPVASAAVVEDELRAALAGTRPQVVGISCALNAFADHFHRTAALVRRMRPEAVVVAGGHYPSCYPDRAVADANIDYLIVGEGEIPLTRFLRDLQQGRRPATKIVNAKTYLEDFDAFPPLDYDRLGVEDYFQFEMSSIGGQQGRTLNLVTSRGCPGHCIYCATHNVWDYGFRPQSAENVFRQVVDLKRRYGVETIMFVDDNFVLRRERVKQFCRLLIENRVSLNWYPTSVQVNSLDEEMLCLMKQAGCRSLGLAVEAGAPRVQKLIRKNVRLDHAKRMAACMRREGLLIHGLFVLGFPGETVAEMQESIRYARELQCDWYLLNIATPLYGTEMYEICKARGYLPPGGKVVELLGVGNITTPEFTPETMEAILRDANWRLNFLENADYLAGRYEKVLPIFESIARNYPFHFICKYMIWQIARKTGRQEQAEAVYRDLQALYESGPDYHRNLIETYQMDMAFEPPAARRREAAP